MISVFWKKFQSSPLHLPSNYRTARRLLLGVTPVLFCCVCFIEQEEEFSIRRGDEMSIKSIIFQFMPSSFKSHMKVIPFQAHMLPNFIRPDLALCERFKTESCFTEHEKTIINTFGSISGSVANIQTTAMVRGHFGMQFRATEIPAGSGSGFLWDDEGHVVTNYHVVANSTVGNRGSGGNPSSVKVKLYGLAEPQEAIIVGVEPEKDLAVLKLKNKSKLPKPITIGTSKDLLVGQTVLAIGNPFGLDNTLTTGIVSAVGRDVQGVGGRQIRGCIQTDAAINPGNSGGPLLDSSGKLIGVNMAMVSSHHGGGNIGIGFAIPVDTVRRVVHQLIQHGRVVRPTMGVALVDDRLVQIIESQVGKQLEGVLIAEVYANSPASQAGLEPCYMNRYGTVELGDLITHIDGEPVTQVEDLLSIIEEKRQGEKIKLRLWKNSDSKQVRIVTVTLTDREQLDKLSPYARDYGY